MCIGGFRVSPRGVLPLGKEGGVGSTGSEGSMGAVPRDLYGTTVSIT